MVVNASFGVTRIAARQRGLVTRQQLLAAGMRPGAIAHRIAQGGLHAVHAGVYAVGHPVLAPLARELAAVLACGSGALLSHRAAGVVLGIAPQITNTDIEVTVPGRHCRGHCGVRAYRVAAIDPRERSHRHGVPLTAPARTLLDLAAVLPVPEFERALADAYGARIVSHRDLQHQLERTPHRRGAGVLRALLGSERRPALTRSEPSGAC